MSHEDPIIVVIGDPAVEPDFAQLDFACRFYGFHLAVVTASAITDGLISADAIRRGAVPALIVVHAGELGRQPVSRWRDLQGSADGHGIPIAVIGLEPDSDCRVLAEFTGGAHVRVSPARPDCGLWVCAIESRDVGFELRGIRLSPGRGAIYQLEAHEAPTARALAAVGASESEAQPVMLRFDGPKTARYLLARNHGTGSGSDGWRFQRSQFGEIVSFLLLLRDAGGALCWSPPLALANLTIDDPWLTEPYGCLSFPGLLAEMQREPFHATIGFVPWNYDRSSAEVVALIKAHPQQFSIAVHGNNHDRYEFFRYASRPGDNQRAKPLDIQAFNIRQALARMETFQRLTGLEFDRVMVFPHGVSPAPTLTVLKQQGFWLTSNYSNVPLDERPPDDLAVALRAANTEWEGFPALRRNYPQNLSEEAIAIDLFLGNPVLFMTHQDLFFDGIDAFTSFARQVNIRQPAVRWTSLGEISWQLHLLRWLDERRCEVRLVSLHAKIENPRSTAVEFIFAKREPASDIIAEVTIDGMEVPWSFVEGEVRFSQTLPPGTTSRVELHYRFTANPAPVELNRRGFRHRSLRLITDFRDLTFSRSALGRFLTRKYYRQGKRRPTVSGLFSRVMARLRGDRS